MTKCIYYVNKWGVMTNQRIKILVCGHGKMGRVHLQSIIDADPTFQKYQIGVVDWNAEHLGEAPNSDHIQKFEVVEDAIAQGFDPELVVMVFNDKYHIGAYEKLLPLPSVKGVIGEKPFCRNAEEAKRLKQYFTGPKDKFLSIHTVINYSSIFDIVQGSNWGIPEARSIIGVYTSWGKSRVFDTRTTTGIISDMTHPVGVLSDVLGLDILKWQSGTGQRGRLSPIVEDVVWAFDRHQAKHYETPVCFDSSYGWDAQQRRVCVLYRHENGQIYLQDYSFDDKDENKTSFDQVHIYGVNEEMNFLHLVDQMNTLSLEDNNKARNYMRTSLKAYDARKQGSDEFFPITDYNHAMLLQEMLADMESGVVTSRRDADPDNLDAPPVLNADASLAPDLSAIVDRIGRNDVNLRIEKTRPDAQSNKFELS